MSPTRTAVICALFVAIGPMSLALYTPALPALVPVFGTTASVMKLTVTIYFLGFAVALLVAGPFSDAFGRRPVLLVFFTVYLAGSLVAALSPSVEWLLLGRVLQGIGAAAGVTAARALVRDLYTGEEAARIMNLVGLMVGIAPAASPTLGGILLHFGWHAIFGAMVAYGLMVVVLAYFMPETHTHPDRTHVLPRNMVAHYLALISDRGFLHSGLLTSMIQGGLYTMPALMPFALIERVGLTPLQYGFAMAGGAGCFMLGAFITGRLLRRFDALKLIHVGVVLVFIAGLAFAIGLRLGPPTFWTVWAPSALWTFGLTFVMPGSTMRALSGFPGIAGSASALLGFLQFGGGLLASAIAALVIGDAMTGLMTLLPIMALLAAIIHWALNPPPVDPRIPQNRIDDIKSRI
ncbi:bicyclomycin resistance protein [Variibacter gotjawalensis]|uniref:Bcr/CflA family efflux transporter n=1 Tax=Variibacter gotjawalensis TaxID=1333996 RepID=A0A0S3PNL7_9BRAD|nr:multidrug effflux MFS transporter [Variibacter gotjawalensis]NIK47814.1 DHA1 family bicyclomycin/chloramphenicol resistance-like MFS transporter [Variibacter gotjawalensis]RZS49701.1 DHA1 family bicyclomycin/chloramphenicol resistance-like MFS transporter [Variibacter gotjawalensis]BAT57530.1 bicyclomycin resistance protein [Variibacter gotjawalensis]